ncbi:hypothetical protein [Bradyrhizobium sp. BR 10289]|uniref:hypothetical protein n=1 Tax=Bradyrhizobium sp. BR 10289 TaxID=2749993 RepID=UPI001C6470DA|nr:hypothetical protein [Bradyrhizobium sp. BR 10289]MBW7972454.1 hypothetical protein [Bradyrhizobium sp. BR 10289]
MHNIRDVYILLMAAFVMIPGSSVVRAADGRLAYFSDEVPVEVPKPELLPSTGQVIFAKVRVMDRPTFLLLPDQSGRPPAEKLREPWSASLQVLNVIRGPRPERDRLNVRFGGGDPKYDYALGPSIPSQLARDYFVAMYEDALGFHLIEIPISAAKYNEWQQEIIDFERERLRSLRK